MSARYIYLIAILLILAGCQLNTVTVQAPPEIRLAAWQEAQRYIDMEYEWGGQDVAKGIDCSGLIINCYRAAISGTHYALLFDDAGVLDLLDQYTVPLEIAETGDLIFMGDAMISHVAIYEKEQSGRIWFIDAYSETGRVKHRDYEITNSKFLAFARLLLEKRE